MDRYFDALTAAGAKSALEGRPKVQFPWFLARGREAAHPEKEQALNSR